ncbi:MAG TPA: transketolase, partial [Sphaerochaeta sp.]|nr:transketolase [Sphaerochaeta sp.]
NLQIDGPIDEVCSPYPIDKKFEAFNFHVINCSAHDFDELRAAFKEARETKGMPTCIVFHSIKGKGVSFMEDKAEWHGALPKGDQIEMAYKELRGDSNG